MSEGVVIHVCVDPAGAGGSLESGDVWTLGAMIEAWSPDAASPPRREPLYLRRPHLPSARLREDMAVFAALAVLKLRLVAEPVEARGRLEAEVAAVLGPSDHAGLVALAIRLAEPVTFDDSRLGPFVLDRRLGRFDGAVDWSGVGVAVHVDEETPEEAAAVLEGFRSLLEAPAIWDALARERAALDLLELKNGIWSEEGETVTAAGFAALLTPEAITLASGGAYQLWYDDGDLFWGHVVVVSGDVETGPRSAEIMG